MSSDVTARARDLCAFIHASPTPHHAAAEAARRLTEAGFHELDEADRWLSGPGAHLVRRGGALVAWRQGASVDPAAGVRLVGAHTDSPNLRLKPHPDDDAGGWRRVAVEPYGGVLWNSWLDRDLGIAGRLVTHSGVQLVRIDEPWLRVPQLAIHLDRDVNTSGLRLDPARHLDPVWGLTSSDGRDDGIVAAVARHAGVDPDAVVAVDLMCHDLTPPTVAGAGGEFVSSARIDNLVSCWAAVEALCAASDSPGDSPAIPMICLFDHEEVGSDTVAGAASTLVSDTLARLAAAAGLDAGDEARLRATSWCLSADGAHATHPTRPEVHDRRHHIALDGGIVVKHNVNQRYATDASGVAWLTGIAERAGVPLQHFSMRNDLPCGSTIGPLSATRLGVRTVDVGVAQLAMHSARELCGTLDAVRLADLLAGALADASVQ